MTLDEAKKILADEILSDEGLGGENFFTDWAPKPDGNVLCIDGHLAIEKLEAIVVYVRHIEETLRNGE